MEKRSYWPTDGEHQGNLSEDSIFITPEIRDFLYNDRTFIICASKGMGKTLLLRYKKQILEETRQEGQVIIPTKNPIDYVKLPPDISFEFQSKLDDYRYWQDLWELSIVISTLTYVSLQNIVAQEINSFKNVIERIKIDKYFKEAILENIDNNTRRQISPSSILVGFLKGTHSAFSEYRNKYANELKECYVKYVRYSVFVFIDSFDQELRKVFPFQNDIWNAGQKGLLLACYDINRNNPHIKPFTSIRHEAYSAFINESNMAMKSSILQLKYSFQQLKDIFLTAVKVYENKNSIEEFIGFKSIHNGRISGIKEDIFKYIYRHTIYTPRSLMAIGGDISKKIGSFVQHTTKEQEIRKLINETSSEIVFKDYLVGEMKEFLSTLNTESNINNFFSIVNKNILTYDNLDSISNFYKRKYVNYKTQKECHPFCDLFNIGLLGMVEYDTSNNKQLQKFKQPFEFDWKMNHILPKYKGKYFLIHPSLNQYILKQNPNFIIHPTIVLGNNYDWNENNNEELNKESIKLFFSYASSDSKKVNEVCLRIRDEMNFRGIYYSSFLDKWNIRSGDYVQSRIESEVDSCDILILLVSKNSLRSQWVEKEWRKKYLEENSNNKVKIICVILDETNFNELPEILRDKMGANLYVGARFAQNVFMKLIDDIINQCLGSNTR